MITIKRYTIILYFLIISTFFISVQSQNNLGNKIFNSLNASSNNEYITILQEKDNYHLIHSSYDGIDSIEFSILTCAKVDLTTVSTLKFNFPRDKAPLHWKILDNGDFQCVISEGQNKLEILDIKNINIIISKSIHPFGIDTIFGNNAIFLSDSTYYVVCDVRDTIANSVSLYLLKFSSNLNLVTKKLLVSNPSNAFNHKLKQHPDGFLLSRLLSSPASLLIFDSNFDLKRTIKFPDQPFSPSDTIRTNYNNYDYTVMDDQILIHGYKTVDTTTSRNGMNRVLSGANTYFGKISEDENKLIEEKNLSYNNLRDNRQFGITNSTNSSLYVASIHADRINYSNFPKNDYSTLVVRKISDHGDVLWERSLFDSTYRIPKILRTNSNNDIVIVGSYFNEKMGVDSTYTFMLVMGQNGNFPPLGIENRKVKKLESLAYPNPTSNSVFISWNTSDLPKATFMLFNLKGQIIKEEVVERKNFIEFETLNYENGLYSYTILFEDGQTIGGKLVIQH
jgi:hypothetical protein